MCKPCHLKIIESIVEQENMLVKRACDLDWKKRFFYFSPAEECSSIKLERFDDGVRCASPAPDTALYYFNEGLHNKHEFAYVFNVPKSIECTEDKKCHTDEQHKEIRDYLNGTFLEITQLCRYYAAKQNIHKKFDSFVKQILEGCDMHIYMNNQPKMITVKKQQGK